MADNDKIIAKANEQIAKNNAEMLRLGQEYNQSIEDQKLATESIAKNTDLASKTVDEFNKEVKKATKALKDLREQQEKENKQAKQKYELEVKRIEADNKLLMRAKQAAENSGFVGFLKKIGFRDDNDKDQTAVAYRARQVAGGIESIFSGNIASGLRQTLSAIPKVANFMGGPYYIALQLTTSALLRLDDAISKTKERILSSTGGVFSPLRDKSLGEQVVYGAALSQRLRKYGLDDKEAELALAAYGSTGLGAITYTEGPLKGEINKNLLANRIDSQAAAMRYMGSLGISGDTINKLFGISRNIEGRSEEQALATQYRLAQRFKASRFFTEQEGAQQSISLYEQTKSLGVNFEWASKTVAKFDRALQLGEISLNDFAAVTKSIRGMDQGRAAGIAELVKQTAIEHGIELPEEFMKSSALGAGLYLRTREGLSNKNIQKTLQLLFSGIGSQMNVGSTKYDQASALGLTLGLSNTNVSPEMLLNVQQGDWTSLLGGRYSQGTNISDEADKLKSNAQKYYEDVRSYSKSISDRLVVISDALKSGVAVKFSNNEWFDVIGTIYGLMGGAFINPVSTLATFRTMYTGATSVRGEINNQTKISVD